MANQSQLAKQARDYIGELYAIEREAKALDTDDRWRLRQQRAKLRIPVKMTADSGLS